MSDWRALRPAEVIFHLMLVDVILWELAALLTWEHSAALEIKVFFLFFVFFCVSFLPLNAEWWFLRSLWKSSADDNTMESASGGYMLCIKLINDNYSYLQTIILQAPVMLPQLFVLN